MRLLNCLRNLEMLVLGSKIKVILFFSLLTGSKYEYSTATRVPFEYDGFFCLGMI